MRFSAVDGIRDQRRGLNQNLYLHLGIKAEDTVNHARGRAQ